MSGQNTRQNRPRLRWVIPASISALLFLGGVAGNLVATDLDPVRKQYQFWVWGFFFLTLIIAVFVAVRDFNRQGPTPDSQDESTAKSEPLPAP